MINFFYVSIRNAVIVVFQSPVLTCSVIDSFKKLCILYMSPAEFKDNAMGPQLQR